MATHKDMAKLLKQLRKEGFVVTGGNDKHYKVTSPDGRTVIISSTCGDKRRGFLNARADLRRIGAKI